MLVLLRVFPKLCPGEILQTSKISVVLKLLTSKNLVSRPDGSLEIQAVIFISQLEQPLLDVQLIPVYHYVQIGTQFPPHIPPSHPHQNVLLFCISVSDSTIHQADFPAFTLLSSLIL